MNTLNVQALNSTDKYITGEYDLEILTLPRIRMEKLKIQQNKTTELEIPNAGLLLVKALEAGDGTILVNRGEKLEWVCNLSAQNQQSYYLQPGNYVVVWRARSLKGSIYTVERKINIRSDAQTTIDLFR
jgi:Ca-activated chloride channel homolog